jgi:Flp pilus assembly protein TadG
MDDRDTRTGKQGTGRQGERGSAAIELALVMCIFCPIALFGTSDLATISYDSIEISSAAHVGALYGMRSTTYASATANIQAAAQAEAPDFGANLLVTPTIFYACSNAISGTQYTTLASANNACTGAGNHSLEFIQVVATVTVPAPFQLPALATSYNMSGTSIMEVQE